MNMHVKAESKFKVGDRVRVTDLGVFDRSRVKVGDIAVITGIGDYCHTLEFSPISGEKFKQWHDNSAFELAPRFAVGDKVRCPSTPEAGVGIIEEVRPEGGYRVHYKDTWFGMCGGSDDDLAPAYTACAAAEVDNLADEYGGVKTFRVGDRVRGVTSWAGIDRLGTVFGIADGGQDNIAVEFDAPFKGHNFGSSGIPRLASGRGRFCKQEDLEHVAVAPATATALQIVAGRYYRTRDGRKVGPMECYVGQFLDADQFGNHAAFYASLMGSYTAAGKWLSVEGDHRYDLIAEWTDEPAAAKFKMGDRVGCTTNRGATYVIKGVNGDRVDVAYITDSGEAPHIYRDQRAAIFFVKPTTTMADIVCKHSGTAIVCLLENGQPLPSTRPFVHSSKDAAAAEASRLAGIHKGQEFGVYECVDVRKVEKTYEHEWQRLAQKANKAEAIASLKRQAGITTAQARRIVYASAA